MKWIRWAVIAGVVSLGLAALVAPGCKGWNTRDFFRNADGALVRECLADGADPNARAEYDGEYPAALGGRERLHGGYQCASGRRCRSQSAGRV